MPLHAPNNKGALPFPKTDVDMSVSQENGAEVENSEEQTQPQAAKHQGESDAAIALGEPVLDTKKFIANAKRKYSNILFHIYAYHFFEALKNTQLRLKQDVSKETPPPESKNHSKDDEEMHARQQQATTEPPTIIFGQNQANKDIYQAFVGFAARGQSATIIAQWQNPEIRNLLLEQLKKVKQPRQCEFIRSICCAIDNKAELQKILGDLLLHKIRNVLYVLYTKEKNKNDKNKDWVRENIATAFSVRHVFIYDDNSRYVFVNPCNNEGFDALKTELTKCCAQFNNNILLIPQDLTLQGEGKWRVVFICAKGTDTIDEDNNTRLNTSLFLDKDGKIKPEWERVFSNIKDSSTPQQSHVQGMII